MDWKQIELAQDGPSDESRRTFRMNRLNAHLDISVRCCVSLSLHMQITVG
jgi:hypothetical protein